MPSGYSDVATLNVEAALASQNDMSEGELKHARPHWRKVLYERQPYPDNYTDPDLFLRGLVTNARVQPKRYWRVVGEAAMVTQQASIVCSVAAAFTRCILLPEPQIPLTVRWILLGDVVLLLLILGGSKLMADIEPELKVEAHRFIGAQKPMGPAFGARQTALLVVGVFLTSPLLQTLTYSISDDTIIAMVVISFLAHLVLHDYSFMCSVTDKLVGSTGLGAAVFASVLLASRLPCATLVFVLMLYALEMFLLFPYLRRDVRRCSPFAHVMLSTMLPATALVLIVPLSGLLAELFFTSMVYITFVCPFFLVRIQKFKIQINGPWDEARPFTKQR
mmetsp:Transcript_1508/g.3174  ORF Transcript_1508/g.3174 Transcript_1508/m.3174 type:complete len:334 (+) Transcript_1508:306-1307(+)|eukprot:CAMPEP_0114224526 /NCGR_PEP_ID=MMETSP0058-20121206/156_1 /TAXON_ID=36894 /ORGANISM="Pyramimonas parkeae, CCMP726" /LENGTH=333 /DNA_ID=CAMNT_0001335011 /DNA_START=225 /DNA_END=1226 /DNA_ORIENTATION=+